MINWKVHEKSISQTLIFIIFEIALGLRVTRQIKTIQGEKYALIIGEDCFFRFVFPFLNRKFT